MEIDGWKYIAVSNATRKLFHDFEIQPNREFKKPEFLYKYYSLNQNNVNSILENKLYINHPCEFNDLYDCSEELISFNEDGIKSILIDNPYSVEEFEIKKKNDYDTLHLQAQTRCKEMFFQKAGIVCFSEIYDNPLMWSYYNNNSGFLVEFDYQKFPFKFHGPFPINYATEIKQVELEKYGLATCFLYQTNIKSKIWEHEKEWRIIVEASEGDYFLPSFKFLSQHGGKERKEKYELNAITTVALGNRFFIPEEIRIIDEQRLIIDLDTNDVNYLLKKTLIEFLLKNNIPTAICLRTRDYIKLQFRTATISKDGNSYLLTSIK